ncbi:hypothetical protein [Brevibacillus panacihumi]|uniref:Uncharacterized protein n=1 Tax=Brevibacillus panacihumi TaxID=497735 RepID=A0A3M8DGB5_9BACL|nr:hypothetical protein [Brevibacillus panacihumi]RNB86375.1 hypothetical protein EDM58_02200 [Brevibacillus panacihumi]
MRQLFILMLVFVTLFHFAPATLAESDTSQKKDEEVTPLPEVINDLAETTLKFNKEEYSPGEIIEFTAETKRVGSYVKGSVEADIDFENVRLRYVLTSTKKAYKVKGKITAPDTEGTILVSYIIKLQDDSGKLWIGYQSKRVTIKSTKTLSLSPSEATIKVGEELLLIGKHSKGRKAETGWNADGDTGYYTLTKNVVHLPDEDGYRKEVSSFVAGKPGIYKIYYGIDYEEDGKSEHVYLSAKITVVEQ